MIKMSFFITMLLLLSCNGKNEEETKTALPLKNERIISNDNTENKINKVYTDTLSFIEYNDDGDYYILEAKKNEKFFGFINDKNDDRSLLKDDIVEIKWSKDTVYIAGDGGTPQIDDWVISVKKIKDGSVSSFRKNYKKQLKYNWSKDENYSQSYFDKLYLIVEYYIANSQNKLIKSAIASQDQLEYSIEEQTRDGKEYTMIGIASVFEHKVNTIQWLYYEHNDVNKLFEYDIPNDNLVEFE